MRPTLSKRILVGYGVVLTLVVLVLVWALAHLRHLGQASEAILRENYESILAAENMVEALERQDSAALLLLLGYDEQALSQYRRNESLFLQWLARAKDNITIQGEERIVRDIDAGYSSYLVAFSQLSLLHQTERTQAPAFYHQNLLPLFQRVHQTCLGLRDANHQTMVQASEHARRLASRAIWSMVFTGLIAVLIGLGFSLLLSSLLVRPLRQMVAATRQVAEGNYDVEVPSGSSDELGQLADEFNAMVHRLRTYSAMNLERIVAEQRRSSAIVESIDDGVLLVDADLAVTHINPAAARALRIDPAQAAGRHFLEAVNNQQLFDHLRQALETGRAPELDQEHSLLQVGTGDDRRYYQFSIRPVQSDGCDTAAGGSMLGLVLLLRDVTKLTELHRLKSEFVMTASHELRTPLTSIGMSVELLLEKAGDKLDDSERALLLAAREDLQRLKALVSELLDLSRIEAGQMQMEFASVPVALVCDKAAQVLRTQAEEKGVELAVSVPETVPLVRADANKIAWVLTNLIANALRYTPSGGHIRVLAEHLGDQVHVSVSDDGAGIPYEYQSRIFDKFVQVPGEDHVGGTGLGLALCRAIVHAHAGTIWVESAPGRGSTFTFTLPVAA